MKRRIVERFSMEEAFRALNVKPKAKLHEGQGDDYGVGSDVAICFYYMNVEDPRANADMIYEIVKKGRNWKYIDARDEDAVGNYKSAYEAIVAAIDAEYEMLKDQDENPEDYDLSGNDDDLHVVLSIDQTSTISDSELTAIKAKIDLFAEFFTVREVEFTLETDGSKNESLNESTGSGYIMVTQGFGDASYECHLEHFSERSLLVEAVLDECQVEDFSVYEKLIKLPPNAFNKQLSDIVNNASDDGMFDDFGIAYVKDLSSGKIIAGVDLRDEIIDMITEYASDDIAAQTAIKDLNNDRVFDFRA